MNGTSRSHSQTAPQPSCPWVSAGDPAPPESQLAEPTGSGSAVDGLPSASTRAVVARWDGLDLVVEQHPDLEGSESLAPVSPQANGVPLPIGFIHSTRTKIVLCATGIGLVVGMMITAALLVKYANPETPTWTPHSPPAARPVNITSASQPMVTAEALGVLALVAALHALDLL